MEHRSRASTDSLVALCAETALVLLVFVIAAAWPVPEVNEPHYLAKAKHFWDPEWMVGDSFLDSADSHWAFYVTGGWLAHVMPLPAAAWCGRLLTWALMAVGWRRLNFAYLRRPWWSVLTAAIFVVLVENFHMAGEWIVGGFEAKGIAYALVFFALAELIYGRWNWAWLLVGAASAMHVLVGGWAAVAMAWTWLRSDEERPTVAAMLPGLVIGFGLALLGIVPGLWINVGVDSETAARAAQIYVYERLPHHLALGKIATALVWRFVVLVFVWFLLAGSVPSGVAQRRLRRAVDASLAIAAFGAVLSLVDAWRPGLTTGLLRFYWFRLSDIFVPLGVSLVAAEGIIRLGAQHVASARAWVAAAVILCVYYLGPNVAARLEPTVPRADKPGKVANHQDWREACDWVREQTPAGARFLTPRSAQTFKWYAGRSEVATWKDVPQDAASMVAWWDRIRDIYGNPEGDADEPWVDSLADKDPETLRRLAEQYDADFLLVESEPPLPFERLFANDSYAVYRLTRNRPQ